MGKRILINYEKCVGCRTCEMVCTLSHEEEINPSWGRIRIIKWEDEVYSIPVNCAQCQYAPCSEVCPVRAISYDDALGRNIVNYKKCIGCRSCIYVCPFGAMGFESKKKRVVKCDLCDGEPLCVKFCAYGTLEYIESDKLNKDKLFKFAQCVSNALIRRVTLKL